MDDGIAEMLRTRLTQALGSPWAAEAVTDWSGLSLGTAADASRQEPAPPGGLLPPGVLPPGAMLPPGVLPPDVHGPDGGGNGAAPMSGAAGSADAAGPTAPPRLGFVCSS